MTIQMISIIGAVLAVVVGSISPALAEGRAIAAAMDGIARQPESAGALSRTLFVGLAMIETMAGNDTGQHLYPDCGFIEVARQVHFAMKL